MSEARARARGVKVYRLPRRSSFVGGMQRLQREKPELADAYLEKRGEPEPTVKFLKYLPDDASEALNRMIDAHGIKHIVGGLVQLLGERCHDNPFDLDNTFERGEEAEVASQNANTLSRIMESLK